MMLPLNRTGEFGLQQDAQALSSAVIHPSISLSVCLSYVHCSTTVYILWLQ